MQIGVPKAAWTPGHSRRELMVCTWSPGCLCSCGSSLNFCSVILAPRTTLHPSCHVSTLYEPFGKICSNCSAIPVGRKTSYHFPVKIDLW
jgi:hypothetical protein